MKKHLYLLLMLLWAMPGLAQLRGQVSDETGAPLPGASVSLGQRSVATDPNGHFNFALANGTYTLKVSFIGYRDTALTVKVPGEITVALQKNSNELQEVTVSTGYQEIPKERATGSFVQLDRKLIERGVSTSIVERLRDNVPGLSLNNNNQAISIRGRSTLFSNAEPLIVLDGFPYNQPITDINPADVENISILKDAAAASIWGAKAGNGVIVINTKKGRLNQPPQVSGSASLSVTGRPDLDYKGHLSSSDYIDIEKRLFSEGFYPPYEAAPQHYPMSPVVELLIAARDGKITSSSANAQIDALRNYNVQDEIKKFYYRPAVNQQYAANLSGGSATQRYYYSVGYDKNLDNAVGNAYDRLTLNGKNTWTFLKDRLRFLADIYLGQAKTTRNAPGGPYWNNGQPIYPYAQLDGPVTKDYRQSFLTAAQNAGLLDWAYRPLDELHNRDNTSRLIEQRLTTGLSYQLPLGFSASLQYQYNRGANDGRDLQDIDSYYTRNLINRFTQVSGTTLTRPIPLGGILDLDNLTSVNHDIRGQLNFDKSFGKHQFTAIAGYEVQSLHVLDDTHRLYGYDSEHAIGQPVDHVGVYTYYDYGILATTIPANLSETDATDHYRSYYANAAYTYDGRLTISGSARLDQSNLFGVRTNQKGVPLWSAGAAYRLDPRLKLRATYGYNGNSNKTLSAYTTAAYQSAVNSAALLPFASIINPPNPELRWERVRNINLGADFNFLNERLSGSLEYFWKQGHDLIGSTAFAPSTGISAFTGNTANTSGHGLDLTLHTQNLSGRLSWTTDLLASWFSDQVTAYAQTATATSYINFGDSNTYPLVGKPLYSIYSYEWAGLDPKNGDPQGYLNGVLSKDYTAILAAATPDNMVFSGRTDPSMYGALRNTFSYKQLSLSFTINYKLGYYFRDQVRGYGIDYGLSAQSPYYDRRWQKAGDELSTNVPSVPAAPNTARDQFYQYSTANVYKGDHIRLQDIRVSYDLSKFQVYAYAANLGILWRANKAHLDPSTPNSPPLPLTLAGGIRFIY